MNKFNELSYIRPDYKQEKENLLKYKNMILNASSYADVRKSWLSMKEAMQYLEYIEETAFIRYLCGISNDFYKEEVRIHNIEDPQIAVLQNECDKLLLNSSYINEFRLEFGDKIINQLSNNIMLSDTQTITLQAEESQLRSEYMSLLPANQRTEEFSNKLYDILDKLIKVRTEIVRTLGYKNYIEMAYRIHGRFDYGEKEIATFRTQMQKLITPACNELRKSDMIKYPDTIIKDTDELIAAIKDMFTDISMESGYYIDNIFDHELFDIADRPNKRQNNFCCCMLPYIKSPFIIGCYHGNSLEANYLIHELGHGYAFYTAARSQKLYEYHHATTSINEIHSKTMEHFAYPYLDRFLGNQKNTYIRNHLFHSFDNLPYRCAIDEFEHAIYDDINLSRTQRCELWAEIENKYMPWRESDLEAIKRGTYWPNQSHLFTHPFYYIEYNIAQISVFEFYERSKHDFGQTWKDYANLCRTGGSMEYLNLLKVGNLSNPFSPGTVTNICKPILDELFSLM
ncbi:MAG TPA: M3 family metallopeptidase [Mobilitalea sp.]|nr:M3 family metallopeptidase [Mobilitalea sp.]